MATNAEITARYGTPYDDTVVPAVRYTQDGIPEGAVHGQNPMDTAAILDVYHDVSQEVGNKRGIDDEVVSAWAERGLTKGGVLYLARTVLRPDDCYTELPFTPEEQVVEQFGRPPLDVSDTTLTDAMDQAAEVMALSSVYARDGFGVQLPTYRWLYDVLPRMRVSAGKALALTPYALNTKIQAIIDAAGEGVDLADMHAYIEHDEHLKDGQLQMYAGSEFEPVRARQMITVSRNDTARLDDGRRRIGRVQPFVEISRTSRLACAVLEHYEQQS